MNTAIAKVAFGGNAIATKMNEIGVPPFLNQPVGPEVIGRGVVRGLRKRQPRITAPFRWAPISIMRGIFNVFTDWHVAREPRLQRLLLQLEEEVVRNRPRG
ncbi:hypothetical protein [Pseudomonas piscis]|uniref:hypothetical protein n=1 Tax=Pseudomonas piscis TaxID=2614538 RepID=UPI0003B7BB5F|nr:hypothetical protein [Pseudomonas piscis]ERO65703.1 hypothetical protein P308_18265 [Pseudomonas piscis]